jgi:transposase
MGWRRGQAYAQDLRDRVLGCGELKLREVAARFGVSPSYVSKARARLRELGDRRPGLQRSHLPLRLAPFADAVCARLNEVPDAKLNDLRSWLEQKHGVKVSYSVLWKMVARLGFTLKKSTYGPPSRIART